MKLSTAILAGGKSRRMNGENKSFLTYQQQTFIESILSQLSTFDETLISVQSRREYEELSYPLVEDDIQDIGPLGGLYSCLKHCRNEYLFVCATDMPLLKKELIEYMLEFTHPEYDCFVIQSADKIHPLCGIYKKSVISTIGKMIEAKDYRLMNLLEQVNTKYIPLTYSCFDESIVANINTKVELAALRKPAVFCVSGVKNSGKTTLITKLIKVLKEEGYRIGVIKHDGHEFEIDVPGTDTYKHRQAGSDTTIIYSETKFAVMKNWQKVQIEELLEYVKDIDVVIIEGMKYSTYPKIEVVRKEQSQAPVCDERYLLAIATNCHIQHDRINVVDLNDIPSIVAIIKNEVIGQKSS